MEGGSYKSFTESTEIRLLTLSPASKTSKPTCSLGHAVLRYGPAYSALSYTWGDRDDCEEITLDGRSFEVTKNLASFLKHEQCRHNTETVFWIDAICINQKDAVEKAQQIPLMRTIYECAANVLIWLGEAANDSDVALTFLRIQGTPDEFAIPPSMITREWISRMARAGMCLYDRPWWNRLWIVQELAVAKSCPMIGAGHIWITWSAIEREKRAAFDAQDRSALVSTMNGGGSSTMVGLCEIRNSFQAEGLMLLSQLLVKSLHRETSVPHDRIYALLGLARGAETIPINYHLPLTKLYVEVAKTCLQTDNNLNILVYCERAGRHPSHDTNPVIRQILAEYFRNEGLSDKSPTEEYTPPTDLPSWVPDWSIPADLRVQPLWGHDEYHASGGSQMSIQISPHTLELKCQCIKIGTIATISNRDIHRDLTPSSTQEDLFELAKTICISLNKPYPPSDDLDTRLYRTLIAAATAYSDQWSTSEYLQCLSVIAGDAPIPQWFGDAVPHLDHDERLKSYVLPAQHRLNRCMRQKRLFVGANGTLGLCPVGAQTGDEVFVLLGADMPFVMRRAGPNYAILGEAYVEGFMEGEALEREDLVAEVVTVI